MYERSYGYKYKETGDEYASAAKIAKLMRADIKVAVSEGFLPGAPVKYSVTSEYYSMGQSINITVKGWPDAWVECDGTVPGTRRTWEGGATTATGCPNMWCAARNDPERAAHATPHSVLSEEARAAEMTLERIHGAYNHDGSDSMVDYFDVRYYGQVQFESAESAKWQAEYAAKNAAEKAARLSGTKVGNVANHNRQGKVTVHVLMESDGKQVLLCGARLGRYSFVATTERPVTCSRCAKRESEVS